ncbi:Serine/threonine-protein kinase [Rhynchospora pubera]|uniref:Receptor-like serine/threonine-protein kinase n=1 Tax=Rhynchospora pubera TaxID=906938 RepID=A0AAV8GY33_9POAL|nr:Serine/threonine-protein kinase [Rhynchospora pubera]
MIPTFPKMNAHNISLIVLFHIILNFTLLIMPCCGSIQKQVISPNFQGSQMDYIDNNGFFLISNSSNFAFGFITYTSIDTTSYLLVVQHTPSRTTVWTANQGYPVNYSDDFVFDETGNAYLKSGNSTVWSSNTSGKGAVSMQLLNSGNLVILGSDSSSPLWQSFLNPTDTLLSGQNFTEGIKLVSQPDSQNLTYSLSIGSGDMRLYANFREIQPYWSMQQDNRIIMNQAGDLYSAVLANNSWNFYDKRGSLLSQLIFLDGESDANATWSAVLGTDGVISFKNLQSGAGGGGSNTIKIPEDSCDTPDPCNPYFICFSGRKCQCPVVLGSDSNCNPDITSPCSSSNLKTSFTLAKLDDGVGYFATKYVSPSAKTDLTGCKNSCMSNCSCLAMFYDGSSGHCFVFSQIGSLQQLSGNTGNYSSFIKVSTSGSGSSQGGDGGGGGNKHLILILIISLTTALVIGGLVVCAIRIHRKKKVPEPSQDGSSEDESFLDGITGVPIRFSYRELQSATDNFSQKLGQGGFGSVYLGKLPDGSRIAVKKLEGIGQGKKEFRSEVSIIGSIHHIHLVKLRGFCAEGAHRLLAYEYMANGSLDRWIFQSGDEKPKLDWSTRFDIALGTARGLAYLHQDCESKIVHCDIKPENVLLDDHFMAKVSDFGLAKLMTREQSHVFTTLRGTRGYLAPEWITNYAISEKSDVYSYGMVLLEIIGGRKNFDPAEGSEKAHFPSFAFKKMEEGKLKEVFDARLKCNDKDERVEVAIKVALWCIQEDLTLRPSMARVVQMLEGLADVPMPPASSQMGFRLYANVFKSISEGTSSGQSDCNSDAYLSAVRLSGPR